LKKFVFTSALSIVHPGPGETTVGKDLLPLLFIYVIVHLDSPPINLYTVSILIREIVTEVFSHIDNCIPYRLRIKRASFFLSTDQGSRAGPPARSWTVRSNIKHWIRLATQPFSGCDPSALDTSAVAYQIRQPIADIKSSGLDNAAARR
jgi:hypothetical protein